MKFSISCNNLHDITGRRGNPNHFFLLVSYTENEVKSYCVQAWEYDPTQPRKKPVNHINYQLKSKKTRMNSLNEDKILLNCDEDTSILELLTGREIAFKSSAPEGYSPVEVLPGCHGIKNLLLEMLDLSLPKVLITLIFPLLF